LASEKTPNRSRDRPGRDPPTFGGPAGVYVADVDGDGDPDLFLGTERRGLFLYVNEGTRSTPAYRPADTVDVLFARSLAPVAADVDGDGDVDLFVGGRAGGLAFYRNTANGTAAERLPVDPERAIQLGLPYPNPAASSVQFVLSSGGAVAARLAVFDVIGRLVEVRRVPVASPSGANVLVSLTGWPAGLYIVKACTEGRTRTCTSRAFVRTGKPG